MFQPAEAWQPQFDPPLPPFRTYNLESWFEEFAAALELNGIWLQAFMFEVLEYHLPRDLKRRLTYFAWRPRPYDDLRDAVLEFYGIAPAAAAVPAPATADEPPAPPATADEPPAPPATADEPPAPAAAGEPAAADEPAPWPVGTVPQPITTGYTCGGDGPPPSWHPVGAPHLDGRQYGVLCARRARTSHRERADRGEQGSADSGSDSPAAHTGFAGARWQRRTAPSRQHPVIHDCAGTLPDRSFFSTSPFSGDAPPNTNLSSDPVKTSPFIFKMAALSRTSLSIETALEPTPTYEDYITAVEDHGPSPGEPEPSPRLGCRDEAMGADEGSSRVMPTMPPSWDTSYPRDTFSLYRPSWNVFWQARISMHARLVVPERERGTRTG
ncbi:hypothetical protein HPB52_022877 [Rhipicephalus sanguineus]|uniref:Uncharacterized protein n=1 Tax=Rhipicephalus sanguineus TaxID=34632 RepID=A0A9D4Q3M9_RHISA|nr:hypothetical protein HPB52_022877 [Rhipicephalus sanguineus]